MRTRTCSAVMTPFSSSSSCIARLMTSCSDGGPLSWSRPVAGGCRCGCEWACGGLIFLSRSGRLQPVLVDFHLDQVALRPAVIRPHVLLRKAHPVEHALRLAVEAVGELLGIRKG